jgi:hypothetical protein
LSGLMSFWILRICWCWAEGAEWERGCKGDMTWCCCCPWLWWWICSEKWCRVVCCLLSCCSSCSRINNNFWLVRLMVNLGEIDP